MPASPTEVVGPWLRNLLDPDVAKSVVAAEAFLDNLRTMFTRRDSQEFDSSPVSILVKVVDGKVTYLQVLEHSHVSAADSGEGSEDS